MHLSIFCLLIFLFFPLHNLTISEFKTILYSSKINVDIVFYAIYMEIDGV